MLGGSPNVWITVNLFFQFLLLLGYCLATVLSRISNWGRLIYVGFALAAAFILPSHLHISNLNTPDSPVFWVLRYLASNLGVPALLLCTAAPLLQYWYGTSKPASNPYLLYAASNIGSFLGILVYPLLLEPRLGISEQFQLWRGAYLALVGLVGCASLLIRTNHDKTQSQKTAVARGAVTWSDRLRWVLLAAIPVSLSLSLTSYITQDLGSFPLIWILPLGLYLLSYIRGFQPLDKPTFLVHPHKHFWVAFIILCLRNVLPIPHQVSFLVSTIIFYQVSKSIHNQLYEHRPAVQYLPQFYLFTASGGVLGGLFNGVVAPLEYKFTLEYPLLLLLVLLISPQYLVSVTNHDNRDSQILGSGFIVKNYQTSVGKWYKYSTYLIFVSWVIIAYAILLGSIGIPNFKGLAGAIIPIGVFTLAAWKLKSTVIQKLVVGLFLFGVLFVFKPTGNYLFADRSFFGNLQVVSSSSYGGSHYLMHGTTLHGFQLTNSLSAPQYGLSSSGIGYYTAVKELVENISSNYTRPIKTAVVGMGSGISALYTQPGDKLDFYEIDPLVVKVARDEKYFSYLKKAPANINIYEGDARLKIQNIDEKYNLLVLDAFSSDAIPSHLLTKEAFQVYTNKLDASGAILVHISNRYFDLSSSVAVTVSTLGLDCRIKQYNPSKKEKEEGQVDAIWLAVGNTQSLDKYVFDWKIVQESAITPWTDNYANLLSAFRAFGIKSKN